MPSSIIRICKQVQIIRIGVTGQSGFIGTHLTNYLGLIRDEVSIIPFRDDYFLNPSRLAAFVKECDAIVHLAAVNRHHDPEVILQSNVDLVSRLIDAMEETGSNAHILFSSSTQEERDNIFGRSKREGREMLARFAEKSGILFTGMIIPNVFGPFGTPYYNSVVATFCHQLTHNETPIIQEDAKLKLIYVGDLVKTIYKLIADKLSDKEYKIIPTYETRVSDILNCLQIYKKLYYDSGIIPDLSDSFNRDLFNTFLCYIDHAGHFPFSLNRHEDKRGAFVEIMKMQSGGQVSFSTTKSGITRGNHFHTRKAERFVVIQGEASIKLRRIGTEEVKEFEINGEQPAYVDIPVWHTHNITNIGKGELLTIFWINEFYDASDPDTYYEEV